MAKMPKEVIDLINDREAVKVLATCDNAGTLNAVPKGSLGVVDEETLVFADIMGNKTNVNLKATGKAVVLAIKMKPLAAYQIKGTFKGFQNSGPLFTNIAKMAKETQNMDVKAVGTIKVDEVYSAAPPKPGAKIA